MSDKREMTAREFANEFRRMCDAYLNCMEDGDDCPLFTANICSLDELVNIVPIVEQWAKEHPEKKHKTYKEDYLEKFPNVQMRFDAEHTMSRPVGCRMNIYGIEGLCTGRNCFSCWNEEMEDEE